MARKNEHGITDQQKLFADLYLADKERNITKAYQGAYPKCKTYSAASSSGNKLLKNPKIEAYIAKKLEQHSETLELKQIDVLREMAAIAFSNIKDYLIWSDNGVTMKHSEEIPKEVAACISEITETVNQAGGSLKFKLHDKVNALIRLGQELSKISGEQDMWTTKKVVGDPDNPIHHVHHPAESIDMGLIKKARMSSKAKQQQREKTIH